MKRDWVRIFSTKSRDGMRSFSPPKGARSTLTNPLRSRTLRLPVSPSHVIPSSSERMGRVSYHTAFIMRRLMV